MVTSSITYPFGFCHVAGHLSTHDQMTQLFSNFTWTQPNLTERESNIVANWITDDTSIIHNLIGYFLYTVSSTLLKLVARNFNFFKFFFSVIASTIAVPSGTFIPVLKLGACLGRLIGESIHLWFPLGVYFSERQSPVIPGKTPFHRLMVDFTHLCFRWICCSWSSCFCWSCYSYYVGCSNGIGNDRSNFTHRSDFNFINCFEYNCCALMSIDLRHNNFIKETPLPARSFTIETGNTLRNCERHYGERREFHLGWYDVLYFANASNGLYKSQLNALFVDQMV